MNSRRHKLTFISLFLLPVLLFHFQNCAPAGQTSASGSSGARLIEDLNKSQIQFISSDAEIQDDAAAADISGLCNRDHNGAELHWKVSAGASATERMASGTVSCDHGQFAVTLDQLDQYVCGVSHLLVVEGDWGASTFSHFSRRCQPLANMPIAVPGGSPFGTTCSLEYSPASAADQPCLQVCYRDNQVVYSQSLGIDQCSSLAAGLAGR